MAVKCSLIIVIFIYEVNSFLHPKPYYSRGPRPRELAYVDHRLQQSYGTPYPAAVRELPANYPTYQNPVQQPNPPIYQQLVEPIPANYPIYQVMEQNHPKHSVYQMVLEPTQANPLAQPVLERNPEIIFHQELQHPSKYPITQQVLEPGPSKCPNYQQPVEVSPAQPVYKPVEAVAEIKSVAPPALKRDKPAGFDSNVLNNLAIALQLLIINNLMNNPGPSDCGLDSIKNVIEGAKVAISQPCESDFEVPAMLNAKFLSSSNLNDGSPIIGYGSSAPSPRISALMKSPYDYLSSTSEYSSSKSNPQNPYAAIFSPDNIKDLFTMSDYI